MGERKAVMTQQNWESEDEKGSKEVREGKGQE